MNSMQAKRDHFRKGHTIRSFNEDGTFVDRHFSRDADQNIPSINAAKKYSRVVLGLHKVAKVSKLPTTR